MTEKKSNLFRYIAGGLLILHGIAIMISGNINISNVLAILADVVMAVSLLSKKDRLFSIGILVCVIQTVFDAVYLFVTIGPKIGDVWYFLQLTGTAASFLLRMISIIPYVLIFISLFDVRKNKKLGLISAGMLLAVDILAEVVDFGLIGILSGLMVASFSSLPIVFAMIAIQNSPQSQHIAIRKKTTPNITTGEKLTKLKELLDMGAITKEEFDAKKKELLNL